MNPPEPASSRAQRQLDRLLEVLRNDPPTPGEDLVTRVHRSARWQRPVRAAAETGTRIAGGLLAGLAAVIGLRHGRRP